jgi:sensor c-di-GMP phosphodiesterase-like protein
MKRRTRKLILTIGAMIVAAAVPLLAGLVASQWWTVNRAGNQLGRYSGAAIDHADRVLAAAQTALDGLAPAVDARCSDATQALLHQTVWDSLYFREAGLIVDRHLVCTGTRRFSPAQTVSVLDQPADAGTGIRITAAKLPADADVSIIVTRSIDAHVALSLMINPQALSESLERQFGDAPIQLLIERSDGMPLQQIGPPSINDNLIRAERSSKQFPLRAVAHAPQAWIQRDALRNTAVFIGFGALLSALLIWRLLPLARRQLSLAEELREALKGNELLVHYQPVMDIQTGECVGAEALIRWRHVDRGMILPGLFLPAAETAGLMLPMTTWLLQRIADEMAALLCWQPRFHISMNLSPKLFNNRRLPAIIKQALGSRIQPWRIVFEITEQHLMNADDKHVTAAFHALRETGALLALDDFGTGYSSLQSLSQFPFDYLKIDKQFISGIGTDSVSARLVPAIVDLAKRLDLTVVAEGVETAEQVDHLRSLGVQFVQGWYFSKALSAEDFRAYCDTHRGDAAGTRTAGQSEPQCRSVASPSET